MNREPTEMHQHAPRVAVLSERVLVSAEQVVALLVTQAQTPSHQAEKLRKKRVDDN